eukprot:Gb_12658 [translate_table: standard]
MVQPAFEDIFTITKIDPDGKKFDKVSRIEACSEQFDTYLILDVNIEVYPVCVGQKFTMALASTISLEGIPDDGCFIQNTRTLADKYEYVMYGKLFKISEDESDGMKKEELYASFGGLLMLLKGDPINFDMLELDQRLYILMRKVHR